MYKHNLVDHMKERLKGDTQMVRLMVLLVLVFIVMGFLGGNTFFSSNNIQSMAFQLPEYTVLAFGMAMAMCTGGIDLSLVSLANLSAIVGGMVMKQFSLSLPEIPLILLGVSVMLLIGAIGGAFNGFLVGYAKIPAMIVTLSTMQIFGGIGLVLTNGSAVLGFPQHYSTIGNGDLFGIPNPFIIMILVAILVYIILEKSTFGRKLYKLGANSKASLYSGIQNEKVYMYTHIICGVLAAGAGMIISSRTISAKVDYGSAYTTLILLVVVLGGVNPQGGFGKIIGVFGASVLIQLLSSGFNILRVSSYFKEFVWGSILILIMIMNTHKFKKIDFGRIRHKRKVEVGRSRDMTNKSFNRIGQKNKE